MNWATHIDLETGRPVETPGARYDETGSARKIVPGPDGAHNWQPMSYSRNTGLVYIPAVQSPFVYKADENFEPRPIGFNLGVNFWEPVTEVNVLPPEFGPDIQGHLLAWNPVTQEEVWRVSHTTLYNGGVLSTAGNLVIQGNTDEEIVAYNAGTGERLWSSETQTGVIAPPVSYSIDGEQYLSVVAGWGGVGALFLGPIVNPDGTKRNISRVLAFKLGGDLELPAPPERAAPIAPPDNFGSGAQIQAGGGMYMKTCAICHGIVAISGGVLPDLRHSPMIASSEAFNNIVIGGALQAKGMVSFAEILSEEDAEAIRAYVVYAANQAAAQ